MVYCFGDVGEINATLLILNVSTAPILLDVGDIWTIELLLCLLNLQITLFPFTLLSQTPCSVLSPSPPPLRPTHDALSVSQPVPCACATAAAAATLQKLGKD